MIKLITINGNSFIANIEEKDDVYVVENPMIFQVIPDPKTQQVMPAMIPVNHLKPITTWTVPKDHVYTIENIELEIQQLYEEFVKQYRAMQVGLIMASEAPSDTNNNKGGGNIIKFN